MLKTIFTVFGLSAHIFAIDDISGMLANLEKGFAKYSFAQYGENNEYLAAKSCLYEARSLKKGEPEHESLGYLTRSCEVMVNAAQTNLQAQKNIYLADSLKQEQIKTLQKIDALHVKITSLQEGAAANLQKKLEANQQRLAEEQKKLAQQQKELEEARALAEEAQQEARNRLDALQSKMISVKKSARGIILSMSDILFKSGKATLTNNLKTSLAKIAGIMTVYKEADLMIEGHTDNKGSESFNQKLSEKRASNVMDFLIEQGLSYARLKSKGFGFSLPIASNNTAKGRAQNRRVDIVITDKRLAMPKIPESGGPDNEAVNDDGIPVKVKSFKADPNEEKGW